MPDKEPELITVPAAIERYQISRSTIERAILRGDLTPYKKIGQRSRLLTVAQLDDLTKPAPTA